MGRAPFVFCDHNSAPFFIGDEILHVPYNGAVRVLFGSVNKAPRWELLTETLFHQNYRAGKIGAKKCLICYDNRLLCYY